MTVSKPRSNLRLLFCVACSIALGLIAGLPMIHRKNGTGLLVVLVVSVLAVFAILITTKRNLPAHCDGAGDETPRTRWKPLRYVALFVIVGSTIAVIGGIVTHNIAPMHPLNVLPNLAALAILGAFAGFVVGATWLIAMLISHR